MSETLEPLIVDLLEWVAREPRRWADVIDAWRTSCPRLPVWEDAVDRGLLRQQLVPGDGPWVSVTPAGLDLLRRHGRAPVAEVVSAAC